MIAKGFLRHFFHASYSAGVVLGFETPEAAAAALPIVGEPFRTSEKDPRALIASLDSDALDAFKARHAARIAILPCGRRHCHPRAKGDTGPCKGTAIDALTHSVDVGPPFSFNAGEVRAAKPKRTRKRATPEPLAFRSEEDPAAYCVRWYVDANGTSGVLFLGPLTMTQAETCVSKTTVYAWRRIAIERIDSAPEAAVAPEVRA